MEDASRPLLPEGPQAPLSTKSVSSPSVSTSARGAPDFRHLEGMRDSLAPLENSKAAQLVKYVAFVFIWVIGTWALIKLLTDFASTLKPLVLAALAASLLEWLVQFWEYFIWKAGNFFVMVVRKCFCLGTLACLYFGWACHACYSVACVEKSQRRPYQVRGHAEPFILEIRNWSMLRKAWHSSYAGQNSFLRLLAVCLTLGLVIAIQVVMYTLVMSNVSAMLRKLNGYKTQMMRTIIYANDHLNKLPELMPRHYQNQTRDALNQFESYLGAETVIPKLETYISTALTGIISQTGSFAIGLVFFFLYTVLWLFVPMHVNAHVEQAKTFTVLPLNSRAHRLRRCSTMEGGVFTEFQQHLYQVIWQYCLAMVIINAVYAGAVLALLSHLAVDMSGFIAIACFFLGFIPELGTIICSLLPVILVAFEPLDSEYQGEASHQVLLNPFADWSTRSMKLGKVILGMIVIKLLVANLLTSIVMGRNQTLAGALKPPKRGGAPGAAESMEEVKETHPVIILFAVVISGEIWGMVGMIISVPIISLMRLAANVWFLELKKQA